MVEKLFEIFPTLQESKEKLWLRINPFTLLTFLYFRDREWETWIDKPVYIEIQKLLLTPELLTGASHDDMADRSHYKCPLGLVVPA